MGSFAAFVDLPEHLRPWSFAGLELLYLPEGLPAQVLEGPQAHVTQAQPSATAAQPSAMTGQPSASMAAALPTPSPQAWPAPWSTLAARVKTPPRVIITYASLADDVSGTADPVRRKLFQSVLGYLAWPQGTILFWPLYFAKGADPGHHFATDLFAEGVRHFSVRHLLCFGGAVSERAKTLFPQDDKALPQVHSAPEPEFLSTLLPHELHKALAHLKAITLP